MPVTLSVIIPAYNEERYLPTCLEAISQAASAGSSVSLVEVIVVDNASTDRTAEIAAEAGAKVVFEAEHKISKVKNAGAKIASGEYLLFVDADTVIGEKAVSRVIDLMERNDVVGGGAYVKYDVGGAVAIPAWLINHVVTRFGRAWGSFLFCGRTAFEDIGGFDEELYGTEELVFCKELVKLARRQNKRFYVIPEYLAVTSGRRIKPQLKTMAKRAYILLDLKKNMRDYDVCRSVWYSDDRQDHTEHT